MKSVYCLVLHYTGSHPVWWDHDVTEHATNDYLGYRGTIGTCKKVSAGCYRLWWEKNYGQSATLLRLILNPLLSISTARSSYFRPWGLSLNFANRFITIELFYTKTESLLITLCNAQCYFVENINITHRMTTSQVARLLLLAHHQWTSETPIRDIDCYIETGNGSSPDVHSCSTLDGQ